MPIDHLSRRRSSTVLAVLAIVAAGAGASAITRAESQAERPRTVRDTRDTPIGKNALEELAKTYAKPTPFTLAGKRYFPYSFEGHVHSQHSRDASHPVTTILGAAEKLGLDAIVITDHGSTRSQHDFADYKGKLVPFAGEELGGTYGHAVSWNVKVNDDHLSSQATLASRSKWAHDHGGLLVFAHPGWWIQGNHRDPMEWMTPQAMKRGGAAGDIDALEIWNGMYRGPTPKLVDSWVAMLEAGVFIPIVGGSDFHSFRVSKPGSARTVAYCDDADLHTCLWPAVRAGRMYVTDGPSLVFSVNDQLPGAILQPPAGSQLDVRVEALAPEGGELRVFVGTTVAASLRLAPGQLGKGSWKIPAPSADGFVRVDIQRTNKAMGQTPMSLLSNPVLIDYAPTHAWR